MVPDAEDHNAYNFRLGSPPKYIKQELGNQTRQDSHRETASSPPKEEKSNPDRHLRNSFPGTVTIRVEETRKMSDQKRNKQNQGALLAYPLPVGRVCQLGSKEQGAP